MINTKLDSKIYYENLGLEKKVDDPYTTKKIVLLLQMIPNDVVNIIDVGCGDGTITNRIAEKYNVVGVDRSRNALKYVNTNTILSNSSQIKVGDSTFDLVLSSELLEHLTDNDFINTIKEFKRISKKYILITFPNEENVGKDFIKCPNCSTVFNRSYHLRSLSVRKLLKYFLEFEIIKTFNYGTGKRSYNNKLLNLKHRFVPAHSWIPKYWTPQSKRKSTCPKCNTTFIYSYKFNLLGFCLDIANMVFSPPKPYWCFLLLKKCNE